MMTTLNLKEDLQWVNSKVSALRSELKKHIVGQDALLDLMMVALLADGHVLLEGVPGVAKTLAAKLLAAAIGGDFKRIQFTPDLMPSDIVGTSVFNPKTNEFSFRKGPIFSNVVLADEINRSPAKTQAALFESMEEKQVTVDGHTYELEQPFLVLATQNPIEQEGTYRLPEAQLDRFMFKIEVHYPELNQEIAILKLHHERKQAINIKAISPVLQAKEVVKMRAIAKEIHVEEHVLQYMAGIVHQTRNHPSLFLGASPRATIAILNAAKAAAAIDGRDFVTPEDVKWVTPSVLSHRIILNPEKEMEGIKAKTVVQEMLKKQDVPR